MLSTALVAIDATVIATAVPSVVADLGGFAEFPWLFSVYLLAQAVTVPVYGKLADVFGRKPVMLFGIGLFLVGSILCGVAWSMGALIAFRAVQGLGAGAVQPMSMRPASAPSSWSSAARCCSCSTSHRPWSRSARRRS
jgi:MFS family permease